MMHSTSFSSVINLCCMQYADFMFIIRLTHMIPTERLHRIAMLQQPKCVLINRQCVTCAANLIRAARLHAKTKRIHIAQCSCFILDYLWTTENDIVPIRVAHGMIQFSAAIKCTIRLFSASAMFFILPSRATLIVFTSVFFFCLCVCGWVLFLLVFNGYRRIRSVTPIFVFRAARVRSMEIIFVICLWWQTIKPNTHRVQWHSFLIHIHIPLQLQAIMCVLFLSFVCVCGLFSFQGTYCACYLRYFGHG